MSPAANAWHHGGVTTHPFLTAADTRTAHLRALEQHMTALELATVSLAAVQRETLELEAAMAVYRRLSDESTTSTTTGNGASRATTKPRAARPAPSSKSPKSTRRVRRPRRTAEPPSFKEFALTHLDSLPHVAGAHAADGAELDKPGRTRPAAA